MITDEEIRRVYQQTHSGDPASPCVSEELLVRAATGEADGSERQRVADHLIACARGAEEYRLLTALQPWAEESATVLHPEGLRAAASVGSAEGSPSVLQDGARGVSRAGVAPSRWVEYALAASVVLALGVGFLAGS